MTNYNNFHKKTGVQTKIINKRNYTYRFLVETLSKYQIKRKEILDIGCGSGTIDFYLANNGAHVMGIDVSDKAIKKMQRK